MEPFKKYWNDLVDVCTERHLMFLPIGRAGRQHIWAVKNIQINKRRLLVVSGIHGDEVAGPLGILQFLRTVSDEDLNVANLTFMPIVSPISFGKRHNAYSRTNCGFISGMNEKLSKEGKILEKNMRAISRWGDCGFLSLHETLDSDSFLIFLYSDGAMLDAIEMRNEGLKFFKQTEDGILVEPGIRPLKFRDGIIINAKDGTLEHRLWRDGSRLGIATETPGRGTSLVKRVEANAALIKKFIELRR